VSAAIIAGLLDDMEESYGACGYLPLYELGWSLRNGGPMTDEMKQLARQAYDEFTCRHATKVMWVRWPIDLDQAWPTSQDDELDFDLDPDGSLDVPLQVVVPATR
jgi:hypothetical protein